MHQFSIARARLENIKIDKLIYKCGWAYREKKKKYYIPLVQGEWLFKNKVLLHFNVGVNVNEILIFEDWYVFRNEMCVYPFTVIFEVDCRFIRK